MSAATGQGVSAVARVQAALEAAEQEKQKLVRAGGWEQQRAYRRVHMAHTLAVPLAPAPAMPTTC